MEAFSVEELARTTDDTAVRRRFDRRNRAWLTVLLFVFTFITVLEIAASFDRGGLARQLIAAVTNTVVNALLLLLMLDARRLAKPAPQHKFLGITRLVRDHVSAVVITWSVVQYALLLAFVQDRNSWMGWAMSFPLFFVLCRFIPAEGFLLHGSFFAGAVVRALVSNMNRPSMIGALTGSAVINLIVLAIVLVMSRRLRKDITSDWSQRRAHAREQLRMRDELQFAREMQVLMLPDAAPATDWLDIASVSLPATEVGGDYYDYFDAGEGRLAIVSSDVAGHGLASGLVLSAFRGGLILLRDTLANPGEVLTRLDDLVAQTSRRRMLVTAAILLLDRDERRAVIASAGHPPIFFRRGDVVETIDVFAPPLGTRLRWTVPRRELPIEPGDIFVLHTDGVYETVNASGESFGLERLAKSIREHDGTTAASLRDAIVRDVEAFRGNIDQADDITIVVVIAGA